MRVCNGRSGEGCAFEQAPDALVDLGDRFFCVGHLPLESPVKNAPTVKAFIAERLRQGKLDLSGLVFPGGTQTAAESYHLAPNVLALRNCKFGRYIQINIYSGDFAGSTFDGDAVLSSLMGDTTLANCRFNGSITLAFTSSGYRVDLDGSSFGGSAVFHGMSNLKLLRFDRCTFVYAPQFSSEGLPQQTTFTDARFKPTAQRAEDEGTYRRIRNFFNENRARDMEGLFYALEKRCQRKALPREPRYWIWRLVSAGYDLTSRYGQSYARAFLWFVGLQATFGVLYSWWSDRLDLSWSPDWQVIAFTLAQVVRPFELFAARGIAGWPYAGIAPSPPGAWAVVTAIHTILSLVLIALLLLAVRWRFRRE